MILDMTNEVVIQDIASKRWLHFREPRQVIRADCVEEVVSGLRLVEAAVQEQGLYAAGFISYEAAPAFDPALQVRPSAAFPLLWFGIYSRPDILQTLPFPSERVYTQYNWAPDVSQTVYEEIIAQIKEHIANGETYQVNYTFHLRAPFRGDTWAFFLELAQAQRADYAAYIDTGRFAVCSASPELFFHLNGSRLTSCPMKGTAARGSTLSEDDAHGRWLHYSEKNRAENVMIVDMIRNDMGRIANVGSVHVSDIFNVERYPTVWQMTSTVTATTNASLYNIMAALFPCASITGAPKPHTMQIIANLETEPRRIYTGCILRRLSDSATYFGFSADMCRIQKRLIRLAASLPDSSHKVRLLMSRDGAISCQATPLADAVDSRPVKLQLSSIPVNSTEPLLYHKTTHRRIYETVLAACPGCDDILFWNERGEITETSIANVVINLDGELITPPVRCGLLPGTFRALLLDQGKVSEKIIKVEALKQIETIYLINSVRKWRKAYLDVTTQVDRPKAEDC
jgi:Anthranilate/para-aminobenzoate synthases component I